MPDRHRLIAGCVALALGLLPGDVRAYDDGPDRVATSLFEPDANRMAMRAFQRRQARLAALGDRSTSARVLRDRVFLGGFEPGGRPCDLHRDRDLDGLPDCVETATGRFHGLSDTGTDPDQADTDGDGLSDGDEVLGTIAGLDLPALGAHPLRRDLLVEYDWFDDALECEPHSHQPSPAVLQRVAAGFAAIGLRNADGSHGIHVIQDVGQGGAFDGGGRIDDANPILPGALDGHFRAIKQRHFAANRLGYFHYVLLPHRYNGNSASSGYAEVIGDDAIVSLYCLNSDDNVAPTILHELGHNLGLRHGGFEACNGKPNYNSVMNYRYQFGGRDDRCDALGVAGTEGFSVGVRQILDESALDEHRGVCGAPPIDWNRDGIVQTALAFDLNPAYAGECGGRLRRLQDFADGDHLTLIGVHDRPALKALQHEVACAGAPASR